MKKYFLILLFPFFSCEKKVSPNDKFDNVQDAGIIENTQIDEASGLVASIKNKDILWTHNDSGDYNRIFALDKTGKGRQEFILEGATNRDWEAIGIAHLPEGSFLYLADIGDNNAEHTDCAIYRVPEPTVTTAASTTLKNVQKITFKYPDGPRDAECMLIDQSTLDIYILTKRETSQRLYKLAYPQSYSQTMTAEFVTTVTFSSAINQAFYITDGNISADNEEILVKNYLQIFHWRRQSNETIGDALKRAGTVLPYSGEPQGEGISFANDGSGYYTISEQLPTHLYWYKRQ